MEYISTRGGTAVTLEQAIMSGTAPDGGLYVPARLPRRNVDDFSAGADLATRASELLTPFFAGSGLAAELPAICAEALNFPVPLHQLENGDGGLSVLELFHGPTAAFKDVGARFLAACMRRITASSATAQDPVTIVVATSGDTGGAVAAAFHRLPGFRVVVLFPEGRVSSRQQHQLTCWGDNIISLAVRGEFDDCQRLAKACFADQEISQRFRLCSANSINVGRLLPQAAYYAQASLAHLHASGEPSSFIIPTGNLGNGFACVWARQMGLPIERIVFATNANTSIPDYLATGQWLPRPSEATLASAMDVGNPSNMERLRHLFPEPGELREQVMAVAVSDQQIRAALLDEYQRHALAWCPHTATAFHAYRHLTESERAHRHWVLAATAHAAKFDSIVEPLLGISVAPPPELAALLELPARFSTIDAELTALVSHL